ncbi:hypothetical protein BASA81_010254 [Batrachochytrium salamandrivorans]|nr:hypothetical protein BASA81_010254 [Batrachochytrium salamandrivorans]
MLLKTLLAKPPPAVLGCDVLVVGGGSGGLACAQAASRLGQSVVLCDYVRPSDHTGTVWGLGGTCVNVGCVPKKLFHRAGYFGQCLQDGELAAFGFEQSTGGAADWTTLRTMVQNHVKMLNFTYRSSLPPNCQYINSSVQFHGNEGVRINNNATKLEVKKAIVIAVGGRPIFPPIPGAELGISSDDVFSLNESPGRTLVVGSSYIGLETASFLNAIGLDTTLLVRSRPLRGIPGFDSDCADKLLSQISDKLQVKRGTELVGLATGDGGKQIRAAFADGSMEQDYDTVLFATGRLPEVSGRLGQLPSSIKVNPSSGKIQVDPNTFVAAGAGSEMPTVYAIGDCAETGSPELTPVAIRQGELVARHVANLPRSTRQWDSLHMVPSTVFSLPSEYSRAGMSEQEAVHKFGADDVEVYQREWEPLETGAAHVNSSSGTGRAYCKLVAIKSQHERVVGLHLITPTSSEAIHGLALSLALGATKDDFDSRVLGIHPTDGEALLDMTVTKASQQDYKVASGCGGGKCG